ncbi:hypothetical protein AB4027_10555 [Alkalibacterium putridalgicola]|uniref:hypothetical protein n=1 Tax=Alkalibacterium putridalgicola TaxID=426703 RepID=UPI0034CF699B
MKKFITAALTGVLLSTAMLPSGISVSAQTETATLTETIEIKNYKFNIEVTDDGYTVKNDETGETSNLRYIDKFNAVVTDSDGNEVSVIKDNYGRTYKDGELIGEYETYYDEERAKMHKKTEDDSISTFAVEYYDDDPLNGHEHYNYYNTTRGSTELEEDVESVVYALASLLPYIGPAFTVIGVLNSMQNSGASTVYTIQDQFHSDGYRYYRYFTTYHEESDYSDLQGSSNQYARMW